MNVVAAMRPLLVVVLLGLASLASHGQQTLPTDVERFVKRRDLCEHFRQEEPYDAERRAFLEKQMRKFCTGTDAKLAALKRKYKGRSDLMAKLGEYEATIESP